MKDVFILFLYLMSFLLVLGSIFFANFIFNSGTKNKSFLIILVIIYITLAIGSYYWGKHLQKK